MKIGVSSYSFSQCLRDGRLDHISVISKAKEMGFEAIEFTDMPREETKENRHALAAKIKEEAAKVGIELSAYVIGASLYNPDLEAQKAEIERVKGELDIAAILGVKLFRYDVIYKLPPHVSFDKAMENFRH